MKSAGIARVARISSYPYIPSLQGLIQEGSTPPAAHFPPASPLTCASGRRYPTPRKNLSRLAQFRTLGAGASAHVAVPFKSCRFTSSYSNPIRPVHLGSIAYGPQVDIAMAGSPGRCAVRTGCRLIEPQAAGRNPLAPLTAMSETVTPGDLLRPVPGRQHGAERRLWNEIDEQSFPAETRRELSQNGIRAGRRRHARAGRTGAAADTDRRAGKPSAENTVDLEQEPAVTMRLLAVRPATGGARSSRRTSTTSSRC